MKLFFGGSFDPIHIGHLLVARDTLELLGFERVVFLPAYQAPLKEPHKASAEDRYNMISLAIEGFQGFEVSRIEIERGGVSYTVDTARDLNKILGQKPYFLVGADSFLSLHLWKKPKELISLAGFVIVDREGRWQEVKGYIREHFPELKEGKDFHLVSVRRVDVSSTEIRQRLKEGKSIKWLVPEKVEEYILSRGLYR